MKFDHSKIFTGDIYYVNTNTLFKDGFGTSAGYSEKGNLKSKSTVLLKMGDRFVPVYHVKNVFSYIGMVWQVKVEKVFDNRFLEDKPSAHKKYCVDNVKPLFHYPGRSSLAELHGIQKEHYENDDTERGFEIC